MHMKPYMCIRSGEGWSYDNSNVKWHVTMPLYDNPESLGMDILERCPMNVQSILHSMSKNSSTYMAFGRRHVQKVLQECVCSVYQWMLVIYPKGGVWKSAACTCCTTEHYTAHLHCVPLLHHVYVLYILSSNGPVAHPICIFDFGTVFTLDTYWVLYVYCAYCLMWIRYILYRCAPELSSPPRSLVDIMNWKYMIWFGLIELKIIYI